ncbi:MAG: response regulator transcription factor [Gluconacetobacter liquefaciens]
MNEDGSPIRLLLIEDDADTAAYVRDGLAHHGIVVTCASDGLDGLIHILREAWDVIVLDRMLPGMDGMQVLARLREREICTPVLLLTTLDGVSSRVEGLRGGADDYLVKPFAVRELAARVAVLVRRAGPAHQATALRVAGITLDLLTRDVTRFGEKLLLQPQEVKVLEYFMRNPGIVLSRKMLLLYAWNADFPVHTNLVETHISRLRDKLGYDGRRLIRTVRGAGYIMLPHDGPSSDQSDAVP